MRKSKLKILTLLLENIINSRNSNHESYDYDILEEEISEVLDWLFIRENGNKQRIMDIVYKEFEPYVNNKFFDNDTYYCMEHLYKFTRRQVSKHTSFNTLDEDEKESIFEPTMDCLVIKEEREFNTPIEKERKYILKSQWVYSYKQFNKLRTNPNVKIMHFQPELQTKAAGVFGKVFYKEKIGGKQ